MASDAGAHHAPRLRGSLLAAAVIAIVVLVAIPFADRMVATVPGFSAAWVATLFMAAVLTTFLLLSQYVGGGSPRLLVLSLAFMWESGIMVMYMFSVDGIISESPSFASAGSGVQWFWLARHVGPAIWVALALAPWPAGLEERLSADTHRRRTCWLVALAAVVMTVGMAVLVEVVGDRLPVVQGPDGTYVTWVVALTLLANLGAASLAVYGIASRNAQHALESWAVVSVVACLGDIVITLLYVDRFTIGYFVARLLALIGSIIVVVAMLRQINGLHRRVRLDAERLEAQNADLVEAQALREHLIAIVSHDLRTPLAGLVGYLEMLQSGDQIEPGQVQRMHRRSWLLARRLTLLTEDLLAVATLEHRDLVIVTEPLDVLDQLNECGAMFPDLDLFIDCPPGVRVHADPLRLQQVLGNLLRNAQKHGRPPVRLAAAEDGDHVTIRVSDGGPGVAADFVPKLFDRYTQGDGAGMGGSGLGLSVVQDLVAAHQGTVAYEIETNTFVVSLPAQPVQQPLQQAAGPVPTGGEEGPAAAASISRS